LLNHAKQKSTFADTLSFGEFLSDSIDRHKDDAQFLQMLDKDFGLNDKMVEALSLEQNRTLLKKLWELNKKHNVAADLLKLNTLANNFFTNHKADIELLNAVRERLDLTIKATSKERVANIYQLATDKESKKAVLALAKFALAMGEFSLATGDLLKGSQDSGSFFKMLQKLKEEDVASAFSLARFSFELMSMETQNNCKVSLPTTVISLPVEAKLNTFAGFLTDTKFGFPSWLSVFRNVAKDNQK